MTYAIATESSSSTILAANSTSALFKFKEFIKTNGGGWYVSASGDGLAAINPNDDCITSQSSGANGLSNTNAWFVITKDVSRTGVGNAFCFQRGASDNQFRVKYSVTGWPGAPSSSSSKTPVSSDEKVILGAGDDSNPTFGDLFRTTGQQMNCHFMAETQTGSWAMFGNQVGQSTLSFFHAFDYVNYANSADKDPYVIILDGKSTYTGSSSSLPGTCESLNGLAGKVKCYVKRGDSTNEYFGDIQAFDPCTDNVSILSKNGSYSLPSSPYTSKDGTLPLIYAKRSNSTPSFPSGIKGQSSLFRWHLQNSRNNYYSFAAKISPTSATTENRIVVGNISLPWDGSSVTY